MMDGNLVQHRKKEQSLSFHSTGCFYFNSFVISNSSQRKKNQSMENLYILSPSSLLHMSHVAPETFLSLALVLRNFFRIKDVSFVIENYSLMRIDILNSFSVEPEKTRQTRRRSWGGISDCFQKSWQPRKPGERNFATKVDVNTFLMLPQQQMGCGRAFKLKTVLWTRKRKLKGNFGNCVRLIREESLTNSFSFSSPLMMFFCGFHFKTGFNLLHQSEKTIFSGVFFVLQFFCGFSSLAQFLLRQVIAVKDFELFKKVFLFTSRFEVKL